MWYMNDEREMLKSMAHDFAVSEIRPMVGKMDETGEFPHEIMKKIGEMGIIGLFLPEDCGGCGPRWVDLGICLEEIGKESNVIANCIDSQYAGTSLLTMLGNQKLIDEVIKSIAEGKFVMATSQCEPAGQTRLHDHKTRFTVDPETNEIVLNGGKIFTTNAGAAEYYLVCAKTPDPEQFGGEFGFILVHKDTPGLTVGHIEHKVGWNGSSTGQMFYNNIRVPMENLLLVMDLDEETTYYGAGTIGALMAAGALGSAEGVYEKTLANARSRMHGDTSIFDSYQAMRHTLAELKMDIELLRGLVYGTLEALDKGDPDAIQLSWIAKVKAARIFEHVASECIVLNGGNGVIRENGIERYFRDAKVNSIGCFALPHIVEMIANHLE